jgi:hypothetical protein
MQLFITSVDTVLIHILINTKFLPIFKQVYENGVSRGSSGSIVSDHGLEDFSSSPCVQTGSGAHPVSYPMGTGDPFPRDKVRPGRDANDSPPSSAEVKYE